MRKDLASAGLEYCVNGNQYRDFHMWRHLYNRTIWTSGESTKVIKDLARHEDIRTTMGYTHTTPKQLHAAVNKMAPLPILPAQKA